MDDGTPRDSTTVRSSRDDSCPECGDVFTCCLAFSRSEIRRLSDGTWGSVVACLGCSGSWPDTGNAGVEAASTLDLLGVGWDKPEVTVLGFGHRALGA